MYLQKGNVKLSVVSKVGKEAVIAVLGPGDFFGEGCLAGQPVAWPRRGPSRQASCSSSEKKAMVRILHRQHALSDRFINTFRRLGFIEYDGRYLKIHNDLLSVVIHG